MHRRGNLSTWVGICCLLLCSWQLIGATNSSVSDYSIDVWQTEQGLPQDSVTSIVHARDGYLWLGTYNGLVRFDGVRFKVFNTSNTPEFRDSRITSLLEDEDGTLWIGHETGDLTQLKDGKFSAVSLGDNWSGGSIWAMGTDVDGVLWLLDREGALLSLQGAKQVAPNPRPVESVPALAKDKNGELWVVRGGLLGTLKKGRLVPWQPSVQPDTSDVQRACASRDGGLWLMGSGRVKKLIGQETVVDRGPAPWGSDLVTALLETKSGDLLVGTRFWLTLLVTVTSSPSGGETCVARIVSSLTGGWNRREIQRPQHHGLSNLRAIVFRVHGQPMPRFRLAIHRHPARQQHLAQRRSNTYSVENQIAGNGNRQTGEGCDDNNTVSGDGCDATCNVESGWYCAGTDSANPASTSQCHKLASCGDGRITTGESCDIGAANGTGVGCDANCKTQDGWVCRPLPTGCRQVSVCGNSKVESGEECDDGNPTSGDGCSSACKIEASYYTCSTPGAPCTDTSRCGDSALEKVETCRRRQ